MRTTVRLFATFLGRLGRAVVAEVRLLRIVRREVARTAEHPVDALCEGYAQMPHDFGADLVARQRENDATEKEASHASH